MKYKTVTLILLLLTAVLLYLPDSALCGPSGILRFAIDAKDMEMLDPHFATESQDRSIAEMMFSRLLRCKPGHSEEIEPDLAENIPEPEMISGGKQRWTFHLRKGVMFHPGPLTEQYELNADDVVFSLQKTFKSVNPIYAGDYSGMSVEKPEDKTDGYTVSIILEKPISRSLFMPRITTYSGGFIVSKRAIETMGYEQFKISPVGTGPFMFESRNPGEKISLKAYPQYFRGCPALEGVEILFMPDIAKREAGLKSGKLDLIDGIADTRWIEKMEQLPNIAVDLQGVGETVMLHFNTAIPPFDVTRVRRAVAYTLRRESFAEAFGNRVVANIYAPVPAQYLTGGLKTEKVKEFGLDYAANIEKAKSLMAEAGYPQGFPLEIVTSERQTYRKYYESMKTQLAAIGIECKLRAVIHSSMHSLIRQDANPLVIYIAWRPDADAVLTRFFHSDATVKTGRRPDANFSHYTGADKLIEAARAEVNPEKQIKLWTYAQLKILDHSIAYPIHYLKPVHARRHSLDLGYSSVTSSAFYPLITEKSRKNEK